MQADYKDIISLSMQHLGIQYLEDNKSEKSLCLSRIAESFSFNDLDEQALSMFQQASKLPKEKHDKKLDFILTEKSIVH